MYSSHSQDENTPLRLVRIRVQGLAEPLANQQISSDKQSNKKSWSHSFSKFFSKINWDKPVVITASIVILLLIFGALHLLNAGTASASTTAEKIVYHFFFWTILIATVGGIILATIFIVSAIQGGKEQGIDNQDREYTSFHRKCGILRVCYGICVAADIFLTLVELVATAIGAYIVLLTEDDKVLVAVMLITSFLASSIRSALNLKYNRMAYAKAFRELEFALDDYLSSNKTAGDIEKLHNANRKAQAHIEYFNE